MWVYKPIINNPQITIFLGGMFTIPKWVVYDIVLPTLMRFINQVLGDCSIDVWPPNIW
jgi:hypothetical protein